MHLSSMVEMIESGFAERALLGSRAAPLTGAGFADLVRRGAAALQGCSSLVYVGENHPLLPVVLFSAAWAGVPFVPLNYRADDVQLNALVAHHPGARVLADAPTALRIAEAAHATVLADWLADLPGDGAPAEPAVADEDVAVVLYTSGTTAAPKSALLRHRHVMAYLLGSVEFGSAGEDEAMLIAVPPYHIAGVANMLSNLFAGRRVVYLRTFDPEAWLTTVRDEAVTHAMVVPTMLKQLVDAVAADPTHGVPTLRSLSYGGARISERVLLDALRLFPDVDFVNAYGLTETASTIAVLGPEDHRRALGSDDPDVRKRALSAGRVLPTVEVEIRDDDGGVLDVGRSGVIFVRGEQVAGEYASGSVLDDEGWFCTRDRGHLDAEGYLYVEGRADDTIIRGGENIAPAEIEAVLLSHPAVADACVVGVPDEQWGEVVVAAVVLRDAVSVEPGELQSHVRMQLRGSKTPARIVVRQALPRTETGKLLRRVVLSELIDAPTS